MRPAEMLLVAARGDWLEGLLPLLFVIIWVVSQVLGLFRRAARQPGEQPAPPRRPAAGRGPADAASESLDEEIEEFLRRTLESGERERRGGRQPQSKRRGPRSKERRRQERLEVPPPLPAAVGSREDVASHVAAAFAHDLAHESPLAGDGSPQPQPASAATELLTALRSPGGLRQLILMREVLDRPTERW
jgi:hypothetical protein